MKSSVPYMLSSVSNMLIFIEEKPDNLLYVHYIEIKSNTNNVNTYMYDCKYNMYILSMDGLL